MSAMRLVTYDGGAGPEAGVLLGEEIVAFVSLRPGRRRLWHARILVLGLRGRRPRLGRRGLCELRLGRRWR